ncbi:unnamed protein product [marine sediment metagenome]|uniref:Uncharacterized protein n=1 Tax=marine sediment metagenome TaxID=412755 RepID=X1MB83_9ZZZZ
MPYKAKKVNGWKAVNKRTGRAMSKKAKSKKAAQRHAQALNINITLKERHPKLYKKVKRKYPVKRRKTRKTRRRK